MTYNESLEGVKGVPFYQAAGQCSKVKSLKNHESNRILKCKFTTIKIIRLKNTNPLKLISSDNKTFDVISCLRHKFFRYQLMLLFKLISLILRISSLILTILPQLMRRSFCHRSDSNSLFDPLVAW